jgi:hypothetical protein
MTFIHDSDRRQREQQRLPAVEARPEAGWGETYVAAFQYAVDEELSISGALNKEGLAQRRDALRDLIDEGRVNVRDYSDRRGRVDYDRLAQEFDTIKSTQTIAEERKEMLRQRREQNQDVMERGSGFAQFLGMASAFALDPINLATLPVSSAGVAARSLSWVGKGLLVARREAALNVATELAIQPLVFQHKSDIDSPYSWRDATANIGMAAAGGAGLGFVSGGVSGYLRAVRDKSSPYLQDAESKMALRSLSETADFLDRTRPNTSRRVLDDEYGKFLTGDYQNISELRAATRSRLQRELAEAQSQEMTMLQMIADAGGLNEKAWKNAGFGAKDIELARAVRKQLPANKPLLRKKGGITPEDLAVRLAETGYIPDGAVTQSRALDIARVALENPELPASRQAAARSADFEDMISRIDSEDDQALEQIFKRAQAEEIEADVERLNERELIREKANNPDVDPDQFRVPEPESVAPQTLNDRQRYVLDRVGLAEEYDQAMEAYARSGNKQIFDAESGRLIDADDVLKEIDDQVEGLNEVLRCTVRA